MAGPPTPVSFCSLKRVEVHDGSTRKSFDASSQGSPLMLSIEAQPTSGSQHSLVLLIHAGFQRLLSVRLSDLLKPHFSVDDVVSTDGALLRLSIRIPTQGQVLIVFFVEARDFAMTVCTLQKSGFQVKHEGTGVLPRTLQGQESFTNGPGVIRARLSSITPMPNFDQSSAPHVPMSTLSTISIEDSIGSTAWPSFDHSGLSMSQPQLPSHSMLSPFGGYGQQTSSPFVGLPSIPPANPYDAFGGVLNSSTAYQPRVSSPLRHAVQAAEPNRSWSNPVITSPYQLPLSTHLVHSQSPDPSRQSSLQSLGTTHALPPPSPQVALGRSLSDLCSAAPGAASSPLEDLDSSKKSTFRDFMPAPRQLPFDSEMQRAGKKPYKTGGKRKRGLETEEGSSGPKITAKQARTSSSKKSPAASRDTNKKASAKRKGSAPSAKAELELAPKTVLVDRSKRAVALPKTMMNDNETTRERQFQPIESSPQITRAPKLSRLRARKSEVQNSKGKEREKPKDERRTETPTSTASTMTTRARTRRDAAIEVTERSTEAEQVVEEACLPPTAATPTEAVNARLETIQPEVKAVGSTASKARAVKSKLRKKAAPAAPDPSSTASGAAQAALPKGSSGKAARAKIREISSTASTSKRSARSRPHSISSEPVQQMRSMQNNLKPEPAAKTPRTPRQRRSCRFRTNKQTDAAAISRSSPRTRTSPNSRVSKEREPACSNCHTAKAACGRGRPTCTRCHKKGLRCVYPASRSVTAPLSHSPNTPSENAAKRAVKATRPAKTGNAAATPETRAGNRTIPKSSLRATPNTAMQPSNESVTLSPDPAKSAGFLPIIFDTTVRMQLEALAEPLFLQYEADVARGCDEEASAKFYLGCLHSVRKQFWERNGDGTGLNAVWVGV